MGYSKVRAWLASGGVTAHSMVQILMAVLHEACMITVIGECFDFNCNLHKIFREDGKPYQELLFLSHTSELLLWSQGE